MIKMFSFLVDKYLFPIRKQIYELIPENSSVLDLGCGTGTQLIILSDKIKYGLGIDLSERKIEFANRQKVRNLVFCVFDADKISSLNQNFDYAICSMFLHTLDKQSRKEIVNSIPAKNLIIADCVKSPSRIRNYLMHFEELFSGHYLNFRDYLEEDKSDFGKQIETFDSGIKICFCKHL